MTGAGQIIPLPTDAKLTPDEHSFFDINTIPGHLIEIMIIVDLKLRAKDSQQACRDKQLAGHLFIKPVGELRCLIIPHVIYMEFINFINDYFN